MKRSIQWIADFVLVAAIAGCGWSVFAPRSPRSLPPPPQRTEVSPESAVPEHLEKPPSRSSPRSIASLLGWRPPAESAAANAKPQPPARPEWLKFLGYVVGSDGQPSYAFKDQRSGSVFSVRPGQRSKGWRLVEARGTEFLLELGGRSYLVTQGD